ncbi:MAG TPA: aspartate/glutamate racemase family protein [Actinomycetospora sp.]
MEGNLESHLAALGVLDAVRHHEGPYDAVVQAGFGEHGREALQEVLDVPVVDITDAAASTAMYLGRRWAGRGGPGPGRGAGGRRRARGGDRGRVPGPPRPDDLEGPDVRASPSEADHLVPSGHVSTNPCQRTDFCSQARSAPWGSWPSRARWTRTSRRPWGSMTRC